MIHRTLRPRKFIGAGILLLITKSLASETISPDVTFQTIKSLAGEWTIRSGDKRRAVEMVYDIAYKGSIVTEQFGKQLSVFYQDHVQHVIYKILDEKKIDLEIVWEENSSRTSETYSLSKIQRG